jgi:hypothetical protein
MVSAFAPLLVFVPMVMQPGYHQQLIWIAFPGPADTFMHFGCFFCSTFTVQVCCYLFQFQFIALFKLAAHPVGCFKFVFAGHFQVVIGFIIPSYSPFGLRGVCFLFLAKQ